MLSIKIKKSQIVILFMYILWFAASYYSLAATFNGLMDGTAVYSDGIFYLIVDVLCMVYIFTARSKKYPKVVLYVGAVWIFQIVGLLVVGNESFWVMTIRISIWFLGFMATYKYLSQHPEDENMVYTLFSLGLVVLSVYVAAQQDVIRRSLGYDTGMNELYIVLLAYPFLFMIQSRSLRIIGIISVLLMTAMSLKLTALFAIGIGTICYDLVVNRIRGNKFYVWLVGLLIALLLIYFFMPQINEFLGARFGIDWVGKIIASNESGGSGRLDIWKQTIKIQTQSTPDEWIIGHGYNSVVNYIQYSAHNDFLEALFDFGLFGFAAYISLYVQLIKKIIRLIASRSEKAPVLCMSVAMFFILSMFSHLLIVPGLLVNCAVVWACCLIE